MKFEELQSIWETQIDAPAFSMNHLGLHLALHQQRQQSRRRLFWTAYFPMYTGTVFMFAVVSFLCLAFYFKTIALAGSRDFPMTLWDGVAFLLSAAGMMTASVFFYLRRRRHEEAQSVVARSLREELDRNIAHLEFQIHPGRGWLGIPFSAGVNLLVWISALLLVWESGRLNGNPTSWGMIGLLAPFLPLSLWDEERRRRKKAKSELIPRKQALEALRAKLDEGPQ